MWLQAMCELQVMCRSWAGPSCPPMQLFGSKSESVQKGWVMAGMPHWRPLSDHARSASILAFVDCKIAWKQFPDFGHNFWFDCRSLLDALVLWSAMASRVGGGPGCDLDKASGVCHWIMHDLPHIIRWVTLLNSLETAALHSDFRLKLLFYNQNSYLMNPFMDCSTPDYKQGN